MVYKLEHL